MTSINTPSMLTLAKTAIAGTALACASAFASLPREYRIFPCPEAAPSLAELRSVLVTQRLEKLGGDSACLKDTVANWDQTIWPFMLDMLRSDDSAQREAAMRMLRWRPDLATRHADVLPVLMAMLADPALAPDVRYLVKTVILAVGKPALVALPYFMADAAGPNPSGSAADASMFVDLSRHSGMPLDYVLALLDSSTATPVAKMSAARYIGQSLPGSARAVPALMRKIEEVHARPQGEHGYGVAGLLDAYLASEKPALAARYLATLIAQQPSSILLNGFRHTRPAPGFNAELAALLDQPALALAAAKALRALAWSASPTDEVLKLAEVKLRAMLADPVTVPTALDCISSMGNMVPALAADVFSYYQTLESGDTARRERALGALYDTGGVTQEQFLFLAHDLVRELRAGYPAPDGHAVVPAILLILRSVSSQLPQQFPLLLEAIKLVDLPGKPFTPEKMDLAKLIGGTHSAAAAAVLEQLLPPMPLADPAPLAWYADTDAMLIALSYTGETAVPVLGRQLELHGGRNSGKHGALRSAMVEARLVDMHGPAAVALLADHVRRVGPALLAALAAPPTQPKAAGLPRPPRRGPHASPITVHCGGMIPESATAITLFRIGRLGLATTPENLEKMAMMLDSDREDVALCAYGALMSNSGADTLVWSAVGTAAAMPGRWRALRTLAELVERRMRYY